MIISAFIFSRSHVENIYWNEGRVRYVKLYIFFFYFVTLLDFLMLYYWEQHLENNVFTYFFFFCYVQNCKTMLAAIRKSGKESSYYFFSYLSLSLFSIIKVLWLRRNSALHRLLHFRVDSLLITRRTSAWQVTESAKESCILFYFIFFSHYNVVA